MARVIVVLLVAAVALAGCTTTGDIAPGMNEGEAGPDGGAAVDGDPVSAGAAPPEWAVGHSWRYATPFGSDFELVVAEDRGDDWFLATPDRDTAWFHYLEEISYLGSIRKSDLAGSQGNDRVQYLDFPLEEGKEWSTTWDGVVRTIQVVEAGKTFRLEAREGDRLAVSYTYDPAKAWFTETTFHGEDGTGATITLVEHRTGWTGDVYRWDTNGSLRIAGDGPAGGGGGSIEVVDGVTDVAARLQWACEGQAGTLNLVLGLIPPTSTDDGIILNAQCEVLDEFLTFEEPTAGPWQLQFYFLAADGGEAQVDVWVRTLHVVTVTS